MTEVFDLNEYFKSNHSLIMESKEKGIPFNYDEQAVEAVYKLINTFIKKVKVDKEKYDDFVQDCSLKFFSYIVYKWNPELGVSIVTYAYQSFLNLYNMGFRKKNLEFDSLDRELTVDESGNITCKLDFISSPEKSPLEQLEDDEWNAYLKDKIANDILLYKYFVEEKSMSQIGREMGYSQAHISRLINKKIEEIRKELNGEKVIIRRR